MQHILQFTIFLVLATAQLTSAAVRGSVLCKVNRFLCFKYSVYMLCTSVMTYFLFLPSFIPVPPLTLDPFTSGTNREKLLQVPFAAPGEFDAHASHPSHS